MIAIKTTELGKSYWNENGAYQKEYEKLYADLVPSSGASKTLNGELIRSISRLFYEYCNNGNGNSVDAEHYYEDETCYECSGDGEIFDYTNDDGEDVFETCDNCCGSGEIQEEYYHRPEVTDFYKNFLDLIKFNVPNSFKEVEEVIEVMLEPNNSFSDEDMAKYNAMCDKVIQYVLSTEDKPLPISYGNYNG